MMWSYDHVAAACAVVTLFYHRQRHRHHRQDYKCVQQLLVKLLFTKISLLPYTTPFSLPPPIATA